MPVIRVSYISSRLNKISPSLVDEIADKKATHVTLHSNQICSLDVKSNNAVRLNHLIDLNLSSNALHKGYILVNHNTNNLLGCCTNLVKLHLGNNGFTSKSLDVFINSLPILSSLTSLDISHNNISKLPSTLQEKSPCLQHLTALSNRIQSLSSLLNVLNRYRGVLESLTLTNNEKGSSNPVCNATLYREKVIFVLGDNLTHLDSRNVSLEERKKARKRLSIYSGVMTNNDDGDDGDDDSSPNEGKAKQHHPQQQQQQHHPQQQQQQPSNEYNTTPYVNDENNNPNSSDIDQKVEFLSTLIEKQARITSGLIEVTQNRNNDEIELCAKNEQDGNGSHSGYGIQVQVENAIEAIDLRRKAASTMIENVLMKDEKRRALVRTALTQWRLLTRFNNHATLLKSRFTKLEAKWRGRANDLVAEAVNNEKKKAIVALRKVEEKNEESEGLNNRVLELESSLQSERDKYSFFVRKTTDESDQLRTDLQKARVTIKQVEEELKRNTNAASAEIESIRDELQHTLKVLEKEKERNTQLQSMVNQISSATEEARNTATANSAELHDLKLKGMSKDTLIEQLKNALEKAATRAASDRSRCEQALASEREKSETLKTCTKKLRGLEAEKTKLVGVRADMEHIVAKKESKVTSLQQIIRENTSTISNLKATVEERECKLDSVERRLKYVSEERDDIQRKISQSNHARMQLQSLLDQAQDEVQKYKRSSSQEHEMETMKLQQALDALRQTSQLREQELSAKLTTLQRKSQHTKDKQAKLIITLKDVERSYRSELEELKRHREHEIATLQETVANERNLRLDAEKKAAALESSQNRQKSKMQNAIADLAKEFTIS